MFKYISANFRWALGGFKGFQESGRSLREVSSEF